MCFIFNEANQHSLEFYTNYKMANTFVSIPTWGIVKRYLPLPGMINNIPHGRIPAPIYTLNINSPTLCCPSIIHKDSGHFS